MFRGSPSLRIWNTALLGGFSGLWCAICLPSVLLGFLGGDWGSPWSVESFVVTDVPVLRRGGLFPTARSRSTSVVGLRDSSTSTMGTMTEFTNSMGNDDEEDDVSSASPGLGAWIPIGSCSALYGLGPVQVEVMGRKLVVWYHEDDKDDDRDGLGKRKQKKKQKRKPSEVTWSVLVDECPHRKAPLSQGRVDASTGCLECPYHGWQFDKDGKVVSIPQSERVPRIVNEKSNEDHHGHGLQIPVHVTNDLIFGFLPSSVHGESFPVDVMPERMYRMWGGHLLESEKPFYVRELPYSADMLVENFMDPAHIPFAHHSLQGVRTDGSPISMSTHLYNATHVECGFVDTIRNKTRVGVLSYQRPGFYHFRTSTNTNTTLPGGYAVAEKEWKVNLGIFVVPVRAGRSRVFFQNFFPTWVPRWLAHAASNRFLNTDTWLHDAEIAVRNVAVDNEDYLYASTSDIGVQVWRKWWTEFRMKDAPPHTFGPSSPSQLPSVALSRRQQIDPWEYHSVKCAPCRRALRWMKRAQHAGLILAIVASSNLWNPAYLSASAPVTKEERVVSFAVTVLGLWLRWFAGRCATVIEGNPEPSGVDDRSVAATTP